MDVKTQEKTPGLELKKSCKVCARAPVCQILRLESEFINKEFLEKGIPPPFKPDEIAQLCTYFLPTTAVRMSVDMAPKS